MIGREKTGEAPATEIHVHAQPPIQLQNQQLKYLVSFCESPFLYYYSTR
jgi:hypothetical protein